MDKTLHGKISTRELFVLGAVSRRPTYGHEIMRTFRLSNARRWLDLSDKHIYYVLRKLEREELVTAREERVGRRPPRNVYEITPAGRDALRAWLHSPALRTASVPVPFDAVFAMLAFTDVITREEALAILKARRDVLATRLSDEYPAGAAEVTGARFGGFAQNMFEKSRILLAAELTWLDNVIQTVETQEWKHLRVPADYLANE